MRMKRRKTKVTSVIADRLAQGAFLEKMQHYRRPRELDGMDFHYNVLGYDIYMTRAMPRIYALVAPSRDVYTFDEANIHLAVSDMIMLDGKRDLDILNFAHYERAFLAYIHLSQQWKDIVNSHGAAIKERITRLKKWRNN